MNSAKGCFLLIRSKDFAIPELRNLKWGICNGCSTRQDTVVPLKCGKAVCERCYDFLLFLRDVRVFSAMYISLKLRARIPKPVFYEILTFLY